jgi:hypothetical protein
MDCKTCDALLADYERSVHVFINAVLSFREAEGDDSTMSVEEADRLQLKCKDARDALMTHLHQDHGGLQGGTEMAKRR